MEVLGAPTASTQNTEEKVSKWTASTVKHILFNPVYAGFHVMGKSRVSKYRGIEASKLPRDKWLYFPDFHEAYISMEDYQKIEGMIQKSKKERYQRLERNSESRELEAIEKISERLRQYEQTKARILPLIKIDIADRIENEEITAAYKRITEKRHLGTQYDWLSTRYATYDDIRGYDKGQIRVLKNSIYARHGRRFKDKALRQYFSSQEWYVPRYNEVPQRYFNKYENANIAFLHKYE